MRLLADSIVDPDEIWDVPNLERPQHRYLSRFVVGNDLVHLLGAASQRRGIWELVTAYEIRQGDPAGTAAFYAAKRQGRLLYRRNE